LDKSSIQFHGYMHEIMAALWAILAVLAFSINPLIANIWLQRILAVVAVGLCFMALKDIFALSKRSKKEDNRPIVEIIKMTNDGLVVKKPIDGEIVKQFSLYGKTYTLFAEKPDRLLYVDSDKQIEPKEE